MGFKLTGAALGVLSAAPPVGRRREQAAEGSLSHIERLALVTLANSARDDTGLAWPSQPTLARIGGCSANTIGPALTALDATGHISIMPGRHGRFALYLIHPGGMGDDAPLSLEAVRAHLSHGRFSAGDQGEVVAWLAKLGRLGSEAACAAIRQAATRALRSSRKAPPTVGGVDRAEGRPDTPSHCDLPPQPLGESPPAVGGEPRIEPEIEPIAREASSDKGEAQRPADPQQGAIQRGAFGIDVPGKSARCAMRETAFDWRGEPSEVLERLRAGGGVDAAKLEGKSDAEALEMIRATQRILFARSSNVKAAA